MLLMHHIFETVPNEDLPGFSFFFSSSVRSCIGIEFCSNLTMMEAHRDTLYLRLSRQHYIIKALLKDG